MFYYRCYFILIAIIFKTNLTVDDSYLKSCNNIVKALELSTGVYNKCLFTNPGENYNANDLKECRNEYLATIERLSYVYKNICNKK